MATADQRPGILNTSFTRGANWSLLVDFSEPASLTGYTFDSGLYSTVNGILVQAVTTTIVDAGTAQINLSLTATAACYLAITLAACYAVEGGLRVVTSPEAVQAFNDMAVRLAE